MTLDLAGPPLLPAVPVERVATPRHYLMCPPTYFDVAYAINPWMHPEEPVDTALAQRQWAELVTVYERLGHRVELLEPLPGLPDMVFAANGGVVVDGHALSSRFRYAERAGEQAPHREWFVAHGLPVGEPKHTLEGEGDILVTTDLILLGSGFRSDPAAAQDVQRYLAGPTGRRLVTLELVDPRYYHLDTALGILDDTTAAYLPEAFSHRSRDELAAAFPELVECSAADAGVLGLNVVSDGRHVVLERAATGLIAELQRRGFTAVGVDLGELRKAGGAVKCCTNELRGLPAAEELRGLPAAEELRGLPAAEELRGLPAAEELRGLPVTRVPSAEGSSAGRSGGGVAARRRRDCAGPGAGSG